MLVNVNGAKCVGIDAVEVTVEVDIRNGVGVHLSGLADTAVKESILRTMTALSSLGYHVPGKKIVINLAPADLHKSGSGYDLPIALGIIAASEQRQMPAIGDYVIMGELGLDGTVREIPSALPFAELAAKGRFKGCILPVVSALEAVEFRDSMVYGVRTLEEAVRILSCPDDAEDLLIWNREEYAESGEDGPGEASPQYMDFSEIVGQEGAKRALEIAASGSHNVILVGAPGSGKSSLSKALAGILPPMTREESLLTSKVYSIAGKGRRSLIRTRPVRSPHYSASLPAIIGGGAGDNIIPGEVSLSNGGVLFLDEFTLMPKSVMEALRGPLEDRKVTISRLRSKVEYPASFMLVAASNPCPCGYWGEGDRCRCTPAQRLGYMERLSGPLMDRIDLQVFVRPVAADRLLRKAPAESSASVAARVLKAREIQLERFRQESINSNAEMSNRLIGKYCPLSEDCAGTLSSLMESMGLSARAYFRIIRVARTIADLAGEADILVPHILEAASYRFLDRRGNI